MKRRIDGESWTGVNRVLRLGLMPDGRIMFWIRRPEEEDRDPEGQEQAACHILFRPGDLPAELEQAVRKALRS